jgi:hypothetical protein
MKPSKMYCEGENGTSNGEFRGSMKEGRFISNELNILYPPFTNESESLVKLPRQMVPRNWQSSPRSSGSATFEKAATEPFLTDPSFRTVID